MSKTVRVRNYTEDVTDVTLPKMRCEAERNFSKLSLKHKTKLVAAGQQVLRGRATSPLRRCNKFISARTKTFSVALKFISKAWKYILVLLKYISVPLKKVLFRGAWDFMECAGEIVCVAGGGFAELTIVVSKYAILRKFIAEITIFF